MTVWDELAEKLRAFVRGEVEGQGHRTRRFRVVKRNPLVCEALDGTLVIEEGDPDVEIARSVLGYTIIDSDGDSVVIPRPQVGDLVLVDVSPEEFAVRSVVTHG